MFFPRFSFSLAGVRYAFVPRTGFDRGRGRVLTSGEAHRVLSTMLRNDADAQVLRRMYGALSHQSDISRMPNHAVLSHLMAWVGRGDGRWSLVTSDGAGQRRESLADPEMRRLEQLVRTLERGQLQQRGQAYRIVLVELAWQVTERSRYETLSAREARQVLKDAAIEATRPPEQRAALSELGASIEKLLVLRRLRSVAAAPQETEVLTASQYREAMERTYIAFEFVTEEKTPVTATIRCEVILPNRLSVTRASDAGGFLRIDNIPPGACALRLLALDGRTWRAENGSASKSVDRAPSQSHVVRRGENLIGIVQRYGFRDWRKIWDDPANEKLRKKRKNPSMLWPGDEVVLPSLEVHELMVPTDAVHRIVVAAPERLLKPRWSA